MTTGNKRAAERERCEAKFPHLSHATALDEGLAAYRDPKMQGVWEGWQAALSARADSGSDARDAEPIYQCMATDDDGNGRNAENLWMDVTKTAYEKMSLRDDVRCRIVFAAIAKGDSK